MSAVVTDTHALIWYFFESTRLSQAARDAFRAAESSAGLIYVPTICLVEIRYLIDKRVIGEDVFRQLTESLSDDKSAPTPIPLSLDVAACLHNISRTDVADMPDRVIAATAFYLDLPLVTRDRKIQSSTIQTIW